MTQIRFYVGTCGEFGPGTERSRYYTVDFVKIKAFGLVNIVHRVSAQKVEVFVGQT